MGMPADTIRRVREEAGVIALEARLDALIPTGALEERLRALEARMPPKNELGDSAEERLLELESDRAALEAEVTALRSEVAEVKKRLDALEGRTALQTLQDSLGIAKAREVALPPLEKDAAPKPKEKKR